MSPCPSIKSSGYLSLTQLFSTTSANITVYHTLPKTALSGLHYVADNMGLTSIYLT